MHRATRQGRIFRSCGHLVLEGQLIQQQGPLAGIQMRKHQRSRFVPPRQAAQIGLPHGKVLRGQMHARQQLSQHGAMRSSRLQHALPAQFINHGGRFATQGEQNFISRIGLRQWNRNATSRQMPHQMQIKRQLRMTQPLKQCEHVLAPVGGSEVIGIFDSARDAAQFAQFTNGKLIKQGAGSLQGHFGKYSHGLSQ